VNRDFAEMLQELSAAEAIGKADLIRNKRATARPKDLLHADNLENGT
jgi:hypothetical protein